MKKTLNTKEALEMQKRAGIITESQYKNKLNSLLEAEKEDDDEEGDDDKKDGGDNDDTFRKMADYFQKMSEPNTNPPVWKSVLAADKKMLAFIDKKIKEYYPGAEKLEDIGNPIWLSDKEAETTVPIAVYKWNDPKKPEGVPDFETPQEAVDWYEENAWDPDSELEEMYPWVIEIAVQKDVDTGDIAYWEIMSTGETVDPYGEPNGWLTGKEAKDSTYQTAIKAGLPKGSPGSFSNTGYGDRTNE